VSRVSRVSKVRRVYQYDGKWLPVKESSARILYRSENGLQKKDFTIYGTHHGPIMAKTNDRWIAMKSNNRSLNGLIQSWTRTKAKSFSEFNKILDLRENVSNNTVYADKEGNIAYWHGNFMPKRDASYDWDGIVDGTSPKTEWKGLHAVKETVHYINPSNGWLQNCNATPFSAAGKNSLFKKDFPHYMAPDAENFRGVNAVRLFESSDKLDASELIKIGYNRYLSAFDVLLPSLFEAKSSASAEVKNAIEVLEKWNKESSKESVATTLAILWAEKILPIVTQGKKDIDLPLELNGLLNPVSNETKLTMLHQVLQQLTTDFGTWQVAWGDINRFQRIENKLIPRYDDAQYSLPSPFASSQWGSLPSFVSKKSDGTIKRYGSGGNSFVCGVEFGEIIKAKSLLAGGESGDVTSPHFKDQAEMYVNGTFKDVFFYKEDVLKNKESEYHPGFEKHN